MSYNIAGKAIKNEYLAIGTILATIGIAVSSGGGDKKADTNSPPPVEEDKAIDTGSAVEDEFIRQFVAEAEKEDSH
ncbi:hypothetical protein CspeluHIS016_0602120 [Cutaneotrichosporon spelunceum]|uniref:Uncharacterized protein n=1 Tax=Cutaneotrichosporon spelunceum TaxID=1672016 RepID=A0AAD3TXK8_9TREE|nr:hypothetical protein CspeluHIS016_0602120 [Cutaneotrichosporon spelunceum]